MATASLFRIVRQWGIILFLFMFFGCSSTQQTITYNETNYTQLSQRTKIAVRFVDGRIVYFYRMEVVKTDEDYIYAKCWAKKNLPPEEWKFLKREVVITNEQSSSSQTATYILSLGLMIGLIFLLNKLLYD